MNKYSYLFKNFTMFSLSKGISTIINIILVSICTYYLTTEEYGIYDLILTSVGLSVPIVSINIQDSVMLLVLEKYKKNNVLTSAVMTVFVNYIIFIILMLIVIKIKKMSIYYVAFFVIITALQMLYYIFSYFYRAIDKVKDIIIADTLNILLMFFLSLLLIIKLKMSLFGLLLAYAIGFTVSIVFLFFKNQTYKNISLRSFDKKITLEMCKLSFPLVFYSLAWGVISASDKYLLSFFCGLEVVGIYSFSYRIPIIISLVVLVFTQSWSISSIKNFDKSDNDHFINNIYKIYQLIIFILCSVLLIILKPVCSLWFSPEYFEAWRYMPPLLIALLLNAFIGFFGNIYLAAKKTKILSLITIIGAIFNAVLNYIFIRQWSSYGAAFATLCGYVIMFVVSRICIKKYVALRMSIREIMSYIVILVQMLFALYGTKFLLIQILLLVVLLLMNIKSIKLLFEVLNKSVQ